MRVDAISIGLQILKDEFGMQKGEIVTFMTGSVAARTSLAMLIFLDVVLLHVHLSFVSM